MSSWIINILVVGVTFILMEGVAWLAHKYIMHGLLWHLHQDHHEPRNGKLVEHNDSFFLIFATPAIICFFIGYDQLTLHFWIGVGITLYGAAYFFIHDLFIHQRIKVFRNANSLYFRAIRRAHKIHHKHLGKEHGECFGMLWAPLKFFREAKRDAA
jgi:beta-carotene 3-hydroxylase